MSKEKFDPGDSYIDYQKIKDIKNKELRALIMEHLKGCTMVDDGKGKLWLPKRDLELAFRIIEGKPVGDWEWD